MRFEFDGETHTYDGNEVGQKVGLAYAISVHKAQGSQFERVAIVVQRSRLLNHALIYTALTRGVRQVVFVGDRPALNKAIVEVPRAYLRSVALQI